MQTKNSRIHLFSIIAGMVIAGVLLAIVSAQSLRAESDVSVGVTVVGPPPAVGATILNPTSQQSFTNVETVTVSGSCAPQTYVVVESNNLSIGTTACALDGTFSLPVQPFPGQNVLTAFNYDDLNVAGPATPSVTITYTPPAPPVSPTSPVPPPSTVTKPPTVSLPANPSVVPGVPPALPGLTQANTGCDSYAAPTAETGGQARLAIVCVPRIIYPGTKILVGIFIYGGTPPYHVTLKWGDNVQTTYIADAPGYHTFAALYASAGLFTVNASMIDMNNNQASSQAVIHVLNRTTSIEVSKVKVVPWYQSDAFWEIVTLIGLFIFVIVLIIYYVRRAN